MDTSVLVRFLTNDDPAKAASAGAFLASQPPDSLLLPSVAMAEMGFVLIRVYQWPVRQVAAAIRAVVTYPAIDATEGPVWLDVADDLDSGHGLVDAYLMRVALESAAPTLITYDQAIKPLQGVTCQQP